MKEDKSPGASVNYGCNEVEPGAAERINFIFGKDQSPKAIADTINRAMGLGKYAKKTGSRRPE